MSYVYISASDTSILEATYLSIQVKLILISINLLDRRY